MLLCSHEVLLLLLITPTWLDSGAVEAAEVLLAGAGSAQRARCCASGPAGVPAGNLCHGCQHVECLDGSKLEGHVAHLQAVRKGRVGQGLKEGKLGQAAGTGNGACTAPLISQQPLSA